MAFQLVDRRWRGLPSPKPQSGGPNPVCAPIPPRNGPFVAFRTGSTTWGVAALYRETGRPAFDADELCVLASISPVHGAAMRARNVQRPHSVRSLTAPGVMLLPAVVFSRQPIEAKAWLSQIYGPDHDGESWTSLLARRPHQVSIRKGRREQPSSWSSRAATRR
jgi:hypothetical protein